MIPTGPDFVAIALQIGNYLREIGPFILFGAVAAAAQVTIFGKRDGPWRGERLIAPIAAIPLGIFPILAAAIRSFAIFQTTTDRDDEPSERPGTLRRSVAYAEDLVFPFILSAALGAVIVVLTPTEPLWTLFSGDGPWRLVIAPLVAGVLRPKGGSELPLIMAMITKGLDPAGTVAALAGSGYRHAGTLPKAIAHVALGAALGTVFWLTGIV